MDLKKKWKTTTRPEGPSGYKRAGTFRDVTLTDAPAKLVDDIDAICLKRGIKRSEFINDAYDNPTGGDYQRYVQHLPNRVIREADLVILPR